MTEVEEMPKVTAMEIDSISVGDGLRYKAVKSDCQNWLLQEGPQDKF